MTLEEFVKEALAFPAVIEKPHFDRRAFKVDKKRIFATLHEKSGTANARLSPAEQKVFTKFEGGSIYPVPNKWGEQGWTTIELCNTPNGLILDILDSAYNEVIKPKQSE